MAIQRPVNVSNACTSRELEVLNQENDADPSSSVSVHISSVHNANESIGTRFLNMGKWIVKNPCKSIFAVSGLLALGLAAGFGIPALLKGTKPALIKDTNNTVNNTVNCTDLDTLYFGAETRAEFAFARVKDGESSVLAEVSSAQTTKNSRIYLDMKELCDESSEILSDSFLVGCTGMSALKFEPTDLKQQIVDEKLNGTRCNPKMNYDLTYKVDLKSGAIVLDSER